MRKKKIVELLNFGNGLFVGTKKGQWNRWPLCYKKNRAVGRFIYCDKFRWKKDEKA